MMDNDVVLRNRLLSDEVGRGALEDLRAYRQEVPLNQRRIVAARAWLQTNFGQLDDMTEEEAGAALLQAVPGLTGPETIVAFTRCNPRRAAA